MSKIHLLDLKEELNVPDWEQNKQNGYRVAKCGYQRKNTTLKKDKVTCKHCLKFIN